MFCLAGLLLNLMDGLTAILKHYGKKQKEPESTGYCFEPEYEDPKEEVTCVCSHCGGVTHGPICEYCGVTLDEFL